MAHMNPALGRLRDNRHQVDKALDIAIKEEVDWLITPELCLSGYYFEKEIGTDWITPQPDNWALKLFDRARTAGVTIFLSCAERDVRDGKCYNSVLVASPQHDKVERHRKVAVQKTSEDWSTKGEIIEPISCNGIKVGIIICADAWFDAIPRQMKEKGAQLFISPSAWPPEPVSPDGCWEKRSVENKLPVFVCNRTGSDEKLDFTKGESMVIKDGERLLCHTTDRTKLLIFDWDMEEMALISHEFTVVDIQ